MAPKRKYIDWDDDDFDYEDDEGIEEVALADIYDDTPYGGDFFYAPRSRPRAVKGGIKAKSKRGAFGESWWAKRWIAVLERFHQGARLDRGRSYARRGQVTSIEIAKGKVTAEVQGSQPRPYGVTIEIKPLSAACWRQVADQLGEEALFAAKLLAGEMPTDIERVFESAGVSLFPSGSEDLTTDCSCPDWSNPCKHIAAVYYLLGEEFDRDPFLLFRLRGMSRQELVRLLGRTPAGKAASKQVAAGKKTKAKRSTKKAGQTAIRKQAIGKQPVNKQAIGKQAIGKQAIGKQAIGKQPINKKLSAKGSAAEPLPADPAVFWNVRELPADLLGEIRTDGVVAALPRRLGSFPFWRGEEGFLEAMERMYREAAQVGLEVVAGRPPRAEP